MRWDPTLPELTEALPGVENIERSVDQMRQAGVTITSGAAAFVEMLHDNASPIAGELYAALDLPATRYILQITQGASLPETGRTSRMASSSGGMSNPGGPEIRSQAAASADPAVCRTTAGCRRPPPPR